MAIPPTRHTWRDLIRDIGEERPVTAPNALDVHVRCYAVNEPELERICGSDKRKAGPVTCPPFE